MPTKTAVFVDVKKFDDTTGGRRVLRPSEFTQMAGRAGRRGKDTEGLVLYLPDRYPLSPQEMREMASSTMAPLTSQLLLSYDFVLRVLHTGRVTFDLLLERSYWARQQSALARGCQRTLARLAAARAKLAAAHLTPDTLAHLTERRALEAALEGKVNAERKEPQRALERWKNSHMGPRWMEAWVALREDEGLAQEEAREAGLLAGLQQSSDQRLAPAVRVLRDLGFIKGEGQGQGQGEAAPPSAELAGGGGEGSASSAAAPAPGLRPISSLTQEDLTLKGVLATEISEGHALLMPSLYLSGLLSEATGAEVICALACMLEGKDGGTEEGTLDVREVQGATAAVQAAHAFLTAGAREGMLVEARHGVLTANKYCAWWGWLACVGPPLLLLLLWLRTHTHSLSHSRTHARTHAHLPLAAQGSCRPSGWTLQAGGWLGRQCQRSAQRTPSLRATCCGAS